MTKEAHARVYREAVRILEEELAIPRLTDLYACIAITKAADNLYGVGVISWTVCDAAKRRFSQYFMPDSIQSEYHPWFGPSTRKNAFRRILALEFMAEICEQK